MMKDYTPLQTISNDAKKELCEIVFPMCGIFGSMKSDVLYGYLSAYNYQFRDKMYEDIVLKKYALAIDLAAMDSVRKTFECARNYYQRIHSAIYGLNDVNCVKNV